jgi:hypothetical protein
VEYSGLMEKKDACYYKVKASAKVWPSAYASGRLVQCRKKGAANYGNKSEGVAEAGPFSYGAKNPRKGGVASNAEQKRKQQDQGKQPIEPRDQMVGVAKVKQGVAEGMSSSQISKYAEELVATTGYKKALDHAIHMAELSRNPEWLPVIRYIKSIKPAVAEGSGPKEKQKTPYRDINSPEYKAAADKQKQRMDKDKAAEPGKKMLSKQGVAEGLNEFAPGAGSNDGGDDGFGEDTLKQLAAQWYNGDEDPRVEQTLMSAGWEIGQDEGYDDTPGVFVVQAGDVNGNSYISWPATELEGLAESLGNIKMNEKYNPEYDDEAGMADNNLETLQRAVEGIDDLIQTGDNLPEWCQEKIAVAKSMLVAVWDYMYSEEASDEVDPEIDAMFEAMQDLVEEIAAKDRVNVDLVWESFEALDDHMLYETAAWRRKEGKSKKGGLNAKGVASYRRENPGSKLQMAVTTKPSKLKPGSKAAKRRKSFCARMSGVKGPMKKPNGKPTRKALALRKWNC